MVGQQHELRLRPAAASGALHEPTSSTPTTSPGLLRWAEETVERGGGRTPRPGGTPVPASAHPGTRAPSPPVRRPYLSLSEPLRPLSGVSLAAARGVFAEVNADVTGTLVAAKAPGWRRGYARGLTSLAGWLGRRHLLDHVEVAGLAQWNTAAAAARGRGLLLSPTHTDLNRDPVVLLHLLRLASTSLGAVSAGHPTASVVTRAPKNALEAFVLTGLARPFVHEIAAPGPTGPALTRKQRRANRRVLANVASDVLSRGEHVALFAQGTTYGDGGLVVRSTGGTRALSRYDNGDAVPLLPVGITYEALGTQRPAAFVHFGAPATVVDPGRDNGLGETLGHQLVALNCVTASGLAGALLLWTGERSPPPMLRADAFCRLLESLSDGVAALAAAEDAAGVFIDGRLLRDDRHQLLGAVYADLRARGYVGDDGALRPPFALARVLTRRGHLEHPLEFAGHRLLAQGRVVVPLGRMLATQLDAWLDNADAEARYAA